MNKCGHQVKFKQFGYLVKFKHFGEVVDSIQCCCLVKIKQLGREVKNYKCGHQVQFKRCWSQSKI